MKKIKIICVFLLVSMVSFGQTTLSIGPDIAIPNSFGLKRVAGSGFGGSMRLEAPLSPHVSFLAGIGYLKFAEKSNQYNTTNFKAIPIQVGAKFYTALKEKIKKGFFISTELGFMPTSTHFKYESNNPDFVHKESGLSIAPGVGYQLQNLEPSFRVQYNLSASGFNIYYFNFRIAYSFNVIKRIPYNKLF